MSDDEEAQAGQAIVARNLDSATRAKYQGRLKGFARYAKEKFPDVWDAEHDEVKWAQIGETHLTSFFGHVSKKRKRGPLSEEVDPPRLSSYEHVNGYKSAIMFAFKEHNLEMSNELRRLLKDLMKGWQRRVAQAKQEGDMPIREGKLDVKPRVYQFLAQQAVEASDDFQQAIFAWAFLTMSWNSLGRSASVAEILFGHLGWATDALTLVFPTHKVRPPPPPSAAHSARCIRDVFRPIRSARTPW